MKLTAKLYKKYKPMISKFAWYLSRKTSIEFEEACSILTVRFCEAVNEYDQDRSAFSTFIYIVLSTQMKTEITKFHKKNFIDFGIDLNKQKGELNQESKLCLLDSIIKHKNEVVKAIVEILWIYRIPTGKYAPFTDTYLRRVLSQSFSKIEIKQGFDQLKGIMETV